jgi:hypothetical protein
MFQGLLSGGNPQSQPKQGGGMLSKFFSPEMLPAYAAMMGGGTVGQQMQGFGMGAANAMQMRRQDQEQQAMKFQEQEQQNKALAFLDQNAPQYADAVRAGVLKPYDAYAQALKEQMRAPTAPDLVELYDPETGMPYKATFNPQTGQFDRVGGVKAPSGMLVQTGPDGGVTVAQGPGAMKRAQFGSIPQGYELIETPEGAQMRPIPGGPADTASNDKAMADNNRQTAFVVRDAIQRVREKINKGGMFNLPEVGVIGSRLAGINTEATDVANSIKTIEGSVAFDRLQRMREASPTGGALGAVSERELDLLKAAMGSLSNQSSAADLNRTLDFIDSVMAKFEAYPGGEGQMTAPTLPRGQTSSGIQWSIE